MKRVLDLHVPLALFRALLGEKANCLSITRCVESQFLRRSLGFVESSGRERERGQPVKGRFPYIASIGTEFMADFSRPMRSTRCQRECERQSTGRYEC